ncbi:MAG: hypothetical protein LBK53_03565 [Heliobacteriaceae bacterium]|jgi:hypothetical protein|nr:hypothetical protein [Heliobacteriaceae bacterium]
MVERFKTVKRVQHKKQNRCEGKSPKAAQKVSREYPECVKPNKAGNTTVK